MCIHLLQRCEFNKTMVAQNKKNKFKVDWHSDCNLPCNLRCPKKSKDENRSVTSAC